MCVCVCVYVCVCDFQKFETIRSFSDNIYTGNNNIDEADMDQSNLLKSMVEFSAKSRARSKKGKERRNTYESVNDLYQGGGTLVAFKSGIFRTKKQ